MGNKLGLIISGKAKVITTGFGPFLRAKNGAFGFLRTNALFAGRSGDDKTVFVFDWLASKCGLCRKVALARGRHIGNGLGVK